ncbi:MAG: hypothetical protein HY391_06255, partial [Deltaproteobacteria bacterium]|nr:hypothetical protein [Deltaproteobacteria bacterium]
MESKILEQYERVIKGVGFYVELCDCLQISGRERTSWLQGMVTQDVAKLTVEEGCFTALCGREGKMVGVAVIYAFETHFLLETEKGLGEKIAAHLNRYLIAEEVEIREVTGEWSAMSLFGPEIF